MITGSTPPIRKDDSAAMRAMLDFLEKSIAAQGAPLLPLLTRHMDEVARQEVNFGRRSSWTDAAVFRSCIRSVSEGLTVVLNSPFE